MTSLYTWYKQINISVKEEYLNQISISDTFCIICIFISHGSRSSRDKTASWSNIGSDYKKPGEAFA